MFDSIGIDKEFILSKVSQYQIFKYYCKPYKEGVLFCSELREDNTPSCKIYNNANGKFIYCFYRDWETDRKSVV